MSSLKNVTSFLTVLAFVSFALPLAGCSGESTEEKEVVPPPADQVCVGGRYIREGADRALLALKSLRGALDAGNLTKSLRGQLCKSLLADLNDTAARWAGERGGEPLEHTGFVGDLLPKLEADTSDKLLSPDLFFYDEQAWYYMSIRFDPTENYSYTKGPWQAGLAAAYLNDATAARLEFVEKVCVPGEVWKDQPDGTRVVVTDPCAKKETVVHTRDGHDEAAAAYENVKSLGARLGLVCGSLRYRFEEYTGATGSGSLFMVDDTYDVSPRGVATPEFAAAIDESIALLEGELATNGTSAYQAMGCKTDEAFVAPE